MLSGFLPWYDVCNRAAEKVADLHGKAKGGEESLRVLSVEVTLVLVVLASCSTLVLAGD